MNLSVRQLRAFVLAAEHGSFSAAAAEMGVTQPGISLLIRQLEDELGLQLFHRTTRRLELSVMGRDMLDSARRTLNQLGALERHAQDLHRGQQGRLDVGVIASVACSLFPPTLARFQKQCPGVKLEFHEEQAAPLLERLRNGELEIGWGLYPSPQPELMFEPLYRDPMIVLMHEDHALASREHVTWSALRKHQFISASLQSGVRIYTDRAAAAAGIEMRPAYTTPSLTTAIGLVRQQIGCAVLPLLPLENLNLERLVMRRLERPGIWRENGLITSKDRRLSPAAQAFVEAARLTASRYTLPEAMARQARQR